MSDQSSRNTTRRRGYNFTNEVERSQFEARSRLRHLAHGPSRVDDIAPAVQGFLPSAYTKRLNKGKATSFELQEGDKDRSVRFASEELDSEAGTDTDLVTSDEEDIEEQSTADQSSWMPPTTGQYVSPFLQLLQSSPSHLDIHELFVIQRCAKNDEALYMFLSYMIATGSSDELSIVSPQM